MRILHVISSLNAGGAEHLLVDLLPQLRDLNNEVELAIFDGSQTSFYKQLLVSGIKVHRFSTKNSVYNPLHCIRLYKLMKQFDIVHTHNTPCQIYGAMAKSGDTILVTTEHSTSNRRRKYRYLHIFDKWMYGKYDRIICISYPSETSLRNYLGDFYPIETILNGIDLTKISAAKPINMGFPGCKLLTMVAAFRYEKDHSTVIKSLLHLPQNYHVIFVGDGDKRSELETLVEKLNLTDRVHMLGIRDDVPRILKASDVIIMSSHREGLSLSNIEGMASGNPFVASDVEGLREVTKGYGLLFPHSDDKGLAEVILKVTTDMELHDDVVKRCIDRAKQYDISNMTEKYNNVYKELYSRH